LRNEYPIIVDWVKERSTVIDLGCGDGTLLQMLKEKGVAGFGIEKDKKLVETCTDKGLSVKEGLIDKIQDSTYHNEFDYAICNVTLSVVEHPKVLLDEMFRISENQIISFPNFAKWQNRLELLFKGRMPQWMLCGYKWYSTGQLHQLSIKDFEEYIKDKEIVKKKFLPNRILPNLTAYTAIYWIR